jgi:hypothetical protein
MRSEIQALTRDKDVLSNSVSTVTDNFSEDLARLSSFLSSACALFAQEKASAASLAEKVREEMENKIQELVSAHKVELASLKQDLDSAMLELSNQKDALLVERDEARSVLESERRGWEEEKVSLLEEHGEEVRRVKDSMTLEMEVELENVRGVVEKKKQEDVEALQRVSQTFFFCLKDSNGYVPFEFEKKRKIFYHRSLVAFPENI